MNKYIGVGIVFLAFIITFFGTTSFAFATDTFSTDSITTTETTTETTTDTTSAKETPVVEDTETTFTTSIDEGTGINVEGQIEKVSIKDAENWAERKGFELVGLLQKAVQPFAIIIFILSAFMAMAGAFGNSQLVGRGIWGMFIAVIMYAVVLYAPEILDATLEWLTS